MVMITSVMLVMRRKTLINKELQEKLKEFPDDMVVILYVGRGDHTVTHDVYEDAEGDLVIE